MSEELKDIIEEILRMDFVDLLSYQFILDKIKKGDAFINGVTGEVSINLKEVSIVLRYVPKLNYPPLVAFIFGLQEDVLTLDFNLYNTEIAEEEVRKGEEKLLGEDDIVVVLSRNKLDDFKRAGEDFIERNTRKIPRR